MIYRHVVLHVDAAPGEDVIQLGAALYDEFFLESDRVFAEYVRPPQPDRVSPGLVDAVGARTDDEFARRMIHWGKFPAVWTHFQDFITSSMAARSFEEASERLVWVGWDVPQILMDLQETGARNGVSVFSEGVPETLSLKASIHWWKTVMGYVGQRIDLGETLDDVCRSWKISIPRLNDAAQRARQVGRAFHELITIEKRAYEAALVVFNQRKRNASSYGRRS